MGATTAIQCPCGKRNCRDARFMWRLTCDTFPHEAAARDFPRFMRYARRVRGVTLSAREMRDLLAKTASAVAQGRQETP